MKRPLAVLTLVLALLGGWGWSAAAVTRVRLASWNLHNFFDERDDRYSDQVFSHEQVEAKIANLAQAMAGIKADVIGLQEVENLPLLQRLAHAAGYRYAVLVEGNDSQRGIDVALLSRTRLSGYRSHRKDALPYVEGGPLNGHYSRDCLEVHVDLGPGLIVLVNHFKAKIGNARSSASKRRSQAQGVARLVQLLHADNPGQDLAVVGDLNDTPESWALEPLESHSWLRDPLARLSLKARYTLEHRGDREAIDHIFLSPGAMARVVPGSARVPRSELIRSCSDHFPVSVELAY